MKKYLFSSLFALGALSFFACSSDKVSKAEAETPALMPMAFSDGVALWKHFEEDGVVGYFNKEDAVLPDSAALDDIRCSDGFVIDDSTLYLDEMENLYMEGSVVKGVCGNAVYLNEGEVAPISINLLDSMAAGTIEFWFKPGEHFFEKSARTLLGNDEARAHFFVQNGDIIFQKNHADKHYFVRGAVNFKDGWNKIAGQWGDGYLSVWVNDELVAKMAHSEGYAPSERPVKLGNLLVAGYKSYCCMEGADQYKAMMTNGAYDQVRVSNVARYKNTSEIEISSSSIVEEISSSSVNFLEMSSSSNILEGDKVQFVEDFEFLPNGVFTYESEPLVLDITLSDILVSGEISFDYIPGESFSNAELYALLGIDEGRLLFFIDQGTLHFVKNLTDTHVYITADVSEIFKNGERVRISGSWGKSGMALYVNDKELAKNESETSVYSPSTRQNKTNLNQIVVGYKSYCCTTVGSEMFANGSFDNLKIVGRLVAK